MENINITMTATTPAFGMPTSGSTLATAAAVVRPWIVQAHVGANAIAGANAAVKRCYKGSPAWGLLTS